MEDPTRYRVVVPTSCSSARVTRHGGATRYPRGGTDISKDQPHSKLNIAWAATAEEGIADADVGCHCDR